MDVTDIIQRPSVRGDLIERLEKSADIQAFMGLYILYFGVLCKRYLHAKEIAAMQEVVAELAGIFFRPPYENLNMALTTVLGAHEPPPVHFLEKMLMLLDENDDGISANDRRLIAICLLRFIPSHPDFFDFYGMGIEKRLERLCSEDPHSEVGIILRNLLLKVRKRLKDHQAQSEPE